MTYNSQLQHRRGLYAFTMIELLVVVSIILILTGLIYGSFNLFKKQAMRRNTTLTCQVVSLAISVYNQGVLQYSGSDAYPSWDWNKDSIIDGRPADDADFSNVLRTAATVGSYTGLIDMLRPDIPKSFVQASSGRIIDPWGGYLHIAWAARAYNGENYGIWSTGETPANSSSHLTSWGAK